MESITFQFAWEVEHIVWIQKLIENFPFLKTVFIACTYFGEPLIIVLILSYVYYVYDKKMARYLILRSMVAGCINPLTKNLFFRNRPYYVNDNIKCLKKVAEDADAFDVKAQGYSFPSGHSTYAGSTYGSIAAYLKTKTTQILMVVVIVLTCVSRYALGVHYPTDVIIGALMGVLTIYLFDFLEKKFKRKSILICFMFILGLGYLYCTTDDYFQTYGLYLGFAFAELFEDKYVNFKNTKNPLKAIIRIIGGLIVFLAFYKGIKLIIPVNIPEYLKNMLITLRLMISVFMCAGLYPMIFKYNILKLDDEG